MNDLPDDIAKLLALKEGLPAGPWTVDNGEALCIRDPDGGRLLILSWRHGLGGRRAETEVATLARAIAALPSLFAELERAYSRPLPEEIAGLVGLGQHYAALESHAPTKDVLSKLAAVLEKMGRELNKRDAVCDSYANENQRFHDRIRELEAERDAAKYEASRWQDVAKNKWSIDDLINERDAVKAKTIEECARVADHHPWPAKTAESMWGLERSMIASAIRALNQLPEA